MSELRALSLLLGVLLVAAYVSFTKEDVEVSEEKVTILNAKPEELLGLVYVTKTQTISMSRREIDGEKYVWFEVKTKSRTRGFTGNDKVEPLIASLAPFEGIRSLGKDLSAEQLDEIKLKTPERKLTLKLKSGDKRFEVGGRTYGSRDHYIKPFGSEEIFLVESKTLGDLEYPDGKFMQRKLRKGELKEIEAAIIQAGPEEKKFLHKNRLSTKDEFWAAEKAPDEKNETAGNYLHKLDALSVRDYPEEPPKDLTEVLKVVWQSEGGANETVVLLRGEDAKKNAVYFAKSTATKRVGEVSKSTAEQLERDLAVILSD